MIFIDWRSIFGGPLLKGRQAAGLYLIYWIYDIVGVAAVARLVGRRMPNGGPQ